MTYRGLRAAALALICCLAVTGGRAQDDPPVYTKQDVIKMSRRLEENTRRFIRTLSIALARRANRHGPLNALAPQLAGRVAEFRKSLDSQDRFENTHDQLAQVMLTSEAINFALRDANLSAETNQAWSPVRADLNALAIAYGLRPLSWDRIGHRITKAQVDRFIKQVEEQADRVEEIFNRALDNSSINSTEREDSLNKRMDDVEDALDKLRRDFDKAETYEETRPQAAALLVAAEQINLLSRSVKLSGDAEREWGLLRERLNDLAGIYYLRPLR
ncbi:MAG TPA: hypothetical protein VJQ56_09930 [Blastocatellia bacterium]|nr:hypothetical protein [Blastocatellia bacterium]